MNKIKSMMIAAAGTLFSLHAMPAHADDNNDTNEESTEISVHVAEELDKMQGIKLSPETFKDYVTNGQPRTDPNKIFLLYNVGQKKFLGLGGYWGTHATLKDVAHLFWLQRRNDTKETHTCYLRYPLTEGSTTGGTTTKNYLSNILSLSSLQVGSAEGNGRSNATYKYVRLVGTDGTSTDLFDEGYAPAGNTFSKDISFDQNAQYIEAEIDLSTCKAEVVENILSVGNKIAAWGAEDATYNLHIYYKISDNELEIDYVSKEENNGTKIRIKSFDPATTLTLKLSKDGLYVNGQLVKELAVTHIPVVQYNKDLAGDIVRFAKNSDGSYKIDDNGYYEIDQENGSGIMGEYYDYLYAYESKSENKQTYFISSAFLKSNAKEREGNYLARTAYDNGASQYGSVGLYADRSVIGKYLQEGQWSIDPVDGQEGVYTFSITFTKDHSYWVQEPDENGTNGYKNKKIVPEENTQLFMQATSEYVKSGNLNDGNNGNYYDDPKGENIKTMTGVELLTTTPAELLTNAANAYWKIISLEDYYNLLQTESSEMKGEVDLTFMLADPNFEKESARLNQWKKDGLDKEGTLKIGMDTYYKTNPNDTAYNIDKYKDINALNNVLCNHGRALGAMIYNGGRGRLYQDAKVYSPGWYTIQCGGMTNANGKLFVQRVDNSQVSEPIYKTLTELTNDDIARHKKPSANNLGWPYTDDMPMYNAVLEINDLNIQDGKYVEEYKNSVKIFIREASNDNPVTLRFGVEVAEEASLVPMLEEESDNTTNKSISPEEEITIFDDFHLLFNGIDVQPELMLSENWTDLNYIENAKYTYDLQPLHLERTFSKGDNGNNWNTIVLPVALTETQVKNAFGENTKLAKLYALTDENILFTYEEPNADGVLLRAYTPYIIKPDNEKGTSKEYSVSVNLNDGTTVTKTVSENHFDFGAVTLAGKKQKSSSASEYYYPISTDYPNYVASYATGNDTENLGTMTIHGTLCKTYTTTSGVNSIIDGRPTLKGGNCYIMKGNVMYRVPDMPNGYGLRGMRCWFEYADTATGQYVDLSKLKLNINGIEDDATSISDITANDGVQTIGRFADGIYSLNGEKVAGAKDLSSLPKGIYIVNGKKFIK